MVAAATKLTRAKWREDDRWFGVAVFRYLSGRSGAEEKLCGSKQDRYLADPEKKHPFDDLGFEVGSVLLGHEALGEVLLLLSESDFQALGDRTSFGWLDLRRLQDRENFRRAHGV